MVKPIEKTSINVLKEKTSVVSASQTFQNLHTTASQSLVENIGSNGTSVMTHQELFESEMLPPDRCVMRILQGPPWQTVFLF